MKHDQVQEKLSKQLLEVFCDELSEAVAALNHDLLIVEASESGRERRASIDRALRLAHSLKGAARVVQANDVEAACHQFEEVLLGIQVERVTPTAELMQGMFAIVDGLARAGQALDSPESIASIDSGNLARLTEDLQVRLSTLGASTDGAAEPFESVPDPELDAMLVALHRDLGRWLQARRRLPSGTDSARFLAVFRGLEAELASMADSLKLSIEEMAEYHVERSGRFSVAISQTARSSSSTLARRRLLVVDDSPTVRALQRGTLELMGYEVITANDGAEGLALFQRHGADLIVTDVDMPNMNGHEMIQAVRAGQVRPDVPIVMVTSMDAHMDRAHAAQLGVDEYLIKSLDNQQQLVAVIESLLLQS